MPPDRLRFLLTTIGTVGDLNGFLGIGDTLRRRGHEVIFLTSPRYGELVGRTGLDFVPVGDAASLAAFLDHPDFYNDARGWKLCLKPLFLQPMRELYEAIERLFIPGRTVAAGSPWSFGARIAQEKLGVPLATIHLETQNLRSAFDTPRMPPPMVVGDWVPRWVKRLQFRIADRWFIDPRLQEETNAFRRSLGLPPVSRFLNGWWDSPQRIIGMYPDWFYAAQPDWPPQMRQTGFSNWDQAGILEPPADLVQFLEGGTAPLVFYAGMNNRHAHRFMSAAVTACAELDERGILVAPADAPVPDPLPPGVRRFEYVPFTWLVPRARALIHHGGRGTASQGLAAGIPHVVTPMTFGQADTAHRLVKLGVARVIRPASLSGKNLAAALRELLNSTGVAGRCREYAARCAESDPLAQTCDLLEGLAGQTGTRQPENADTAR